MYGFSATFMLIFRCTCGMDPPLSPDLLLVQTRANVVDPNGQLLPNKAKHPKEGWEFVGTSCGDFHPGDCRQKPTTNCTKHQAPTFFYAGPPNSGSTSLAWELNLHHQISYGRHKEHVYLSSFGDLPGKLENRSLHDYINEFYVDCEVKHTFDATPNVIWLANEDAATCTHWCMKHLWHAPGVPALRKLKTLFGEHLKFIMMFREPMEMIMSAASGYADAIEYMVKERWRTCYADSVEKWLEVFPRKNFLFLDSNAYFKNPRGTLREAFTFLEVEPKRFTDEDLQAYGRRRQSKYTPRIRSHLHDRFYADDVNLDCKTRLEKLTGLHFNWGL